MSWIDLVDQIQETCNTVAATNRANISIVGPAPYGSGADTSFSPICPDYYFCCFCRLLVPGLYSAGGGVVSSILEGEVRGV